MNEKLNKIAKILGLTLSSDNNQEEQKLSMEGILADGTKVYSEAEDFVVGAALMVVAEDGSMSPAPEGEHTLDNGKVLVVDAQGVITEVKEAEEPAGDEPGAGEEELSDDEEDEEKVYAEITPEQQTAIVAELMQILEPRIAALEETLLKSVEKLSETNNNLNEKVEKLSKSPAAEAVKPQLRAPREQENALKGLLKNKK
jgi:hypothetical protein